MAGPDLSTFLAQAARKPFVWGAHDCLLYAADWVWSQCAVDPAAEFRGTYSDHRAARRLIAKHGGLLALIDAAAAKVRWRSISSPVRGCVGVVRAPLKRVKDKLILVPVGAICVSPTMWAVKPADEVGLVAKDFPLIAAWAPHG